MASPDPKMLQSQKGEIAKNSSPLTFLEAQALKNELVWKNLAGFSLAQAVDEWLSTLQPLTKKNYSSGVRMLHSMKILNLTQSLQAFALVNHDVVIDKIKGISGWSECSKQARSALYIALTRFLSRRTEGVVKRATPNREGTGKTFFRVRDKVKSVALSQNEWSIFIKAMEKVSIREALITKLCLQGARRITEVLKLQIEHIDFEKNEATFFPSKTKGLHKEIVVTFPMHLAVELREYIGGRKIGPVFITSKGKAVTYTQIRRAYEKATILSGLSKRIHTHVFRTSAITHFRVCGYQDYEIQRLTGHATTQMLSAYDKTNSADNVSKKTFLI